MAGELSEVAFNWVAGESLSNVHEFNGSFPAALAFPAGWSASVTTVTFEVEDTLGTKYNLYDKFGVEYTVAAGASRYVPLPPVDHLGTVFKLRIRRGTSGTPYTTGAASLRLTKRSY